MIAKILYFDFMYDVIGSGGWKTIRHTIDSKTPYAGEREVELYTDYQAKGGLIACEP